jgi:hypothetical protein
MLINNNKFINYNQRLNQEAEINILFLRIKKRLNILFQFEIESQINLNQ